MICTDNFACYKPYKTDNELKLKLGDIQRAKEIIFLHSCQENVCSLLQSKVLPKAHEPADFRRLDRSKSASSCPEAESECSILIIMPNQSLCL